MLFKPVLTFSLAVLAQSAMAQLAFPLPAQGGISIIRNLNGNNDTRIHYQPNTGDLVQLSVSGPFDVGPVLGNPPWKLIAPAAEVLSGTPIATAVLGPDTWREESIHRLYIYISGLTIIVDCQIQQVHIFFLSRDLTLSHYYWSSANGGYRGGPSCSQCLTKLGVKVLPCYRSLSTTIDSVNNIVSVVFMDANNNGTISEAVRRNGAWAVSRLT